MGAYDLGSVADLGATDAYNAWATSVKARGGVVTAMPDIPAARARGVVGAPAGRFPLPAGKTATYQTSNGQWAYELATAPLVLADKVAKVQQAATIAIGKAAGVAQDTAQAVLDAPRNAVSAITGIPKWLIPGLLIIGGGLYAAKMFGVTASTFKRNPRGRRRRVTRRRRR